MSPLKKYGCTFTTAKAAKKNAELTEDDLKTAEKSIQDITDKYIKNVDAVTAKKEKEIMQI